MGIELKKSTLKAILATSIVFLAVIGIVVFILGNKIDKLENETENKVYRVVAKTTIKPGEPISEDNVKRVLIQDVVKVEDLAYKLAPYETDKDGNIFYINETGNKVTSANELNEVKNDGRYVFGKIATQTIYENELVSSSRLATKDEYYDYNERLYAVPFDAETTGGYNVAKGEYVDIAVRYKTDINLNDAKLNSTVRKIYDSLKPNQITDVVLAKRLIEDIRDEAGESIATNSATKPGFICFRLTYDEINKLEWARECGTIYIGKSRDYSEEAFAETFMQGIELPSIGVQ